MDAESNGPGLWRPDRQETGLDELTALAKVHRHGLAVTRIVRVPEITQEHFYRYGNLVARLAELFRGVDPTDPDEDDLEELAPAAMDIVMGSYLLDEVVDTFYDSVRLLAGARRVRRPGSAGLEATGDRASLLALKRVWAEDWSSASLAGRLAGQHSFRLEAEPVLIHAADGPATDSRLAAQVERLLGRPVTVYVTADGSISRLA